MRIPRASGVGVFGRAVLVSIEVLWCDDLADSASCLAKLEGAAFTTVVDNWSTEPKIRDTNINDIQYQYSGSFSAVSKANLVMKCCK